MGIEVTTLSGDHWQLHVCDVFDGLARLQDQSAHVVVTSPPYWAQRDYGFSGQIGLERTPGEFVQAMVNVFREVSRVLRDDGLLFLNLGDSYCKDSKFGGTSGSKHEYYADQIPRSYRATSGLTPGNLVGIPWRVALALQEDGWVLRRDIVWRKPTPMPESITGMRWRRCRVKVASSRRAKDGTRHAEASEKPHGARDGNRFDSHAKFTPCPGCDKCRDNGGYYLQRGAWRPTGEHEYVFMFSKSRRYFADGDGSQEPVTGGAHSRGSGLTPKSFELVNGSSRDAMPKANTSFHANIPDLVETRNIRSVWSILADRYKGKHFATFPRELVRRCLSAAISPAGCCAGCGEQLAPVVEMHRMPTRPGHDSKVTRASAHEDSPYHGQAGMIVGNRDPYRHVTIRKVEEYRPTCQCGVGVSRPTVLDPFAGTATTGQVAISMGADFVGIEASAEYAEQAVERLNTPWTPGVKKAAKKRPMRVRSNGQLSLFTDDGGGN